jgi:hypothetical protein
VTNYIVYGGQKFPVGKEYDFADFEADLEEQSVRIKNDALIRFQIEGGTLHVKLGPGVAFGFISDGRKSGARVVGFP